MPTDGEAEKQSTDADAGSTDDPAADEVVDVASTAAEDVVLSRFSKSDLDDYDVTVTFEDGMLEVDVYVRAAKEGADEDQVAEDAALAAQSAVDDLF